MTNGVILDTDDVRKIIAEKFHVDESAVIKAQYSFIVKMKEEENGKSNQADA